MSLTLKELPLFIKMTRELNHLESRFQVSDLNDGIDKCHNSRCIFFKDFHRDSSNGFLRLFKLSPVECGYCLAYRA